jgi:Tol biopolymer transport system component
MKVRIATLLMALVALAALAPAAAGGGATTERASVTSDELEALGGHSREAAVSRDGRFIAFISEATNLAGMDGNSNPDIFVRDRLNGTTERVSVNSDEAEATGGDSFHPSISGDGRYVAFNSHAPNLVAMDGNLAADVFVRDRLMGTTERVSVDSNEVEAGGGGDSLTAISPDGRYVAFESTAPLVAGDSNSQSDIFVRDRQNGTTVRASVSDSEAQAMGASFFPSISDNGNLVSFLSTANNLTAADLAPQADIFVRDLSAGTTTLVSVSSAEIQGNAQSESSAISGNGQFVVFIAGADNLVPDDTNPSYDAFLRDLTAGTTERVSIADDEAQMLGGNASEPAITPDGRFIAFHTPAYNLVADDSNGYRDVFVRDRQLGTTERVSVTTAGAQVAHESFDPSISGDGGVVAFDSESPDLVGDDTNDNSDVFVHAYDIDVDGVSDFSDNCPTVANSNGQGDDQDGDIAGDACDAPGTGNADCNQAVNAVDSLKILRYAAGLSVVQSDPCKDIGEVIGSGFKQADVDCSGTINSVDALKVLRAAASLSVSSSCTGPVIGT